MEASTALAVRGAHDAPALAPRTFAEAQHFAETVARSTFVPDAYRGKPGDVLACIIAGHELGIGPMQALRAIHVVKGKPILSADLMIALVKRSDECEYFRLVESTPERCTYETLRRGDPEPTRIAWTMEDARRAELTRNPTWKNHPAPMLRARCGSALARAVYPDLVMGIYDETEGEEIAARPPATRPPAPSGPVHVEAVPVVHEERPTLAPDWRDGFRAFLRGAGFGAEDYPAVCAVVAAQAERDIVQMGDIEQGEARDFGQTLKGLARLLGGRGHDDTAQARLVVWAHEAGRVGDLFASVEAANRVLYDWEGAQALAEAPPDPDGMFGPPAISPRHQDPA